jgi:hypothetical protein
MSKSIQTRLETLEQAAGDTGHRGPVILLRMNETEAQALERCGHPPGTEAFFIKLVPLQPRPIGGQHAKA